MKLSALSLLGLLSVGPHGVMCDV